MSLRNLPLLCSQGDVHGEVLGAVGVITLDRPAMLNAITLPMVRDITALLLHWAADPDVVAIVLQGRANPGQGTTFSAGSDPRFLHRTATAGLPELDDHFTELYALIALMHRFAKPVVALMDGTTMSAGLSLAQAARLRVVTERTRIGVPDVHLGLFPDAGASWYLSRCPGHMGEYLALTGHTIGGADALAMGLADLRMVSADLPALVEALVDQPMRSGEQVMATVHAHAVDPGVGLLVEQRGTIDGHFGVASATEVANSLQRDAGTWAARALAAMERASPLMMAVTLEHLRRARNMELAEVLRMERSSMRHAMHGLDGQPGDAMAGLSALVVEHSQLPAWSPASLEDVAAARVQRFFQSPWPDWAHPLRGL